jgi:hypothetical protein
MRKKTAMAAVVTLFAVIALSAQPNQAPADKQPSANQGQTPVVLPAPEKQDRGADDQPKADPNAPTSHTPIHDPNWMLVIVGIITCCVIGWQSWETRSAAKASRIAAEAALKSVKLQEAQLTQWVETTDEWDVRTDHYLPSATGTVLRISFGIVNPTKWPLALNRVRVRVHEDARDYPIELALGPEEFHRMDFSIPLQGQIFTWFKASYFDAEISLDVWFIDNLKERRVQAIDLVCRCYPTRKPELHFRPRAQRDEAHARYEQYPN